MCGAPWQSITHVTRAPNCALAAGIPPFPHPTLSPHAAHPELGGGPTAEKNRPRAGPRAAAPPPRTVLWRPEYRHFHIPLRPPTRQHPMLGGGQLVRRIALSAPPYAGAAAGSLDVERRTPPHSNIVQG